jgi:ElaB/YqjD/DUF883 family membrane-anchored ribosome-binding protein
MANRTQSGTETKDKGTEGMGKQITDKADQGAAAAGRGMQTAADKIRENTPNSGVLGSAAEAVSSRVESGGRYLEERGVTGMTEDFTTTIRNNPASALLIAVGVGFLLGMAISRR